MKYWELVRQYHIAREHTNACPWQNCIMDYMYDILGIELNKRTRKRMQHKTHNPHRRSRA